MIKPLTKKNLGESIRQRLKNLSIERNRPFDEILRYYAMERFLYRLSISPYVTKLVLKGGMLLKILDPVQSRATMDIDFLAQMSNHKAHLLKVVAEIGALEFSGDAIIFDTKNLTLRETQTGGDYQGVSAHFSARLFNTVIPIRIDMGFNDIVIPEPRTIQYPTLLDMPSFKIMGYTLETVIAEKLQSIVKLALINTRMKDFYDLWTLCKMHELHSGELEIAIKKVFANRETPLEYPIAFTEVFSGVPETRRHWQNFLSVMGKKAIDFDDMVKEIAKFLSPLFEKDSL